MKYYKTLSIILLVTLSATACLQNNKKEEANSYDSSLKATADLNEASQANSQTSQVDKQPKLKYFNVLDTRDGTIIERYPFPATWKQHTDGEYAYTGPNGVKVIGDRGMNYAFSNDPTILRQYEAVGWLVKYPLSMDEVVDQEIVPFANTINRKLTKKYPLKQILDFDSVFNSLLFKVEQNPVHLDAMGIEWVDPDGTKWLTVLHYQIEQGYNNAFWSYRGSAIGSDPEHFEQVKKDYLNGLLNRQLNTEWIKRLNQKNEYTIKMNNAAHEKREAEFKAGVAKRQKEWEVRQEANTLRQEHISDVISGKVNIVNPADGEKWKVDHKNNYYWVNSDGKYVGTDDYKYDPNKDDYINNRTWKEFKIDTY